MTDATRAFVLCIASLGLIGCATPRQISPTAKEFQSDFRPQPQASAWYIKSIMRDDFLCHQTCVGIVISEDPSGDTTGTIVLYPNEKIPGLLQTFGVPRSESLVGKKVALADEKHPFLGEIVKEGISCSRWGRESPLIHGRNWC